MLQSHWTHRISGSADSRANWRERCDHHPVRTRFRYVTADDPTIRWRRAESISSTALYLHASARCGGRHVWADARLRAESCREWPEPRGTARRVLWLPGARWRGQIGDDQDARWTTSARRRLRLYR